MWQNQLVSPEEIWFRLALHMLDKHYYPGKLLSGFVSMQIHLPGLPSWFPWLGFKAEYECSFCNSFSYRCVSQRGRMQSSLDYENFSLQTWIEHPLKLPCLWRIKCLYGGCISGSLSFPVFLCMPPSVLYLPTTAEIRTYKTQREAFQWNCFWKMRSGRNWISLSYT